MAVTSPTALTLRHLAAWPPTGARVRLLAVVLLISWVSLGIAIVIVPGISARTRWDVLLAAVLLALLAAALRPLLAAFATVLGWAGVFAGWLLAQALLVYLALRITPGVQVSGFWPAFWASWIYSALASAGLWLVTAGDNEVVLAHLLRTTRRANRADAVTDTRPGVVMIQIDGLSAPLVEWAVRAGNLPTLTRWIRSGRHTITEWHAQLPATTPASQAGLLHGTSDHVPAFRWYEKDSGRLVVTNHPKDSAFVEERMSDGRGLLADGGVSLSNVFSGDAPTSVLTMSTAGSGRRSGPSREVSAYVVDPFGFTRSLVLTIGEMIKELFQARRQRLRGIEPRIDRSGSYVALRGVTNVLLRDLNMTMLAEHMRRGAPAIYCDFVDYDEIAHHAGPTRAESMASLDGLDHVIGLLEQVSAVAPRPYEFIVLSDHGQSQGATFLQRYGLRLEDVVRQLMAPDESMIAAPEAEEQWGRVRTLLTELGRGARLPARISRRLLRGHRTDPQAVPVDEHRQRPELIVLASGNLGLVYFPRQPGRLTAEEIEAQHPGMLTALAAHPGIGFVLVRSQERGAMAIGRSGTHLLDAGTVEGDDPLAAFGPHAVADLKRYDALANVPDILLNSRMDPGTDEVAAFEELVGCHGGLGGWQTRPVLIHPAQWPVEQPLKGSDDVHRQLIHWLDMLGHRRSPPVEPV